LRELAEVLQVAEPCRAALRVARAQGRRDQLLEQRRLAVGRGPERAQVARRHAVVLQLQADGRDVDVRLGIALVATRAAGREQAEVLELFRELARDTRAAAELVEVDPLDALLHSGRPTALAALRAG